MTNRDMVKPGLKPKRGQAQEPIDSPQPNASAERAPPAEGEIGLTTKR